MNAGIFRALRPGGVFAVVDHHAPVGAGTTVANEHHRIERAVVVNEVTAGGFGRRFELSTVLWCTFTTRRLPMKLTRPIIVLTLCTSSLIGFTARAHEEPGKAQTAGNPAMPAMTKAGMKDHSVGSKELHAIMTAGMQMPMKMTGNVDKDFATMMTMHHQQALKMADVLIKHGENVELKALARKMKAAQQDEIEKMKPFTK